jgi:hypothetical protein
MEQKEYLLVGLELGTGADDDACNMLDEEIV